MNYSFPKVVALFYVVHFINLFIHTTSRSLTFILYRKHYLNMAHMCQNVQYECVKNYTGDRRNLRTLNVIINMYVQY